MADELDYSKDVVIDKNHLDVELATHGRKYMRWVEELAKAESDMDKLKERILVYRSELSTKIRQSPDKYGIDKVTEGSVSAAIDQDKGLHNLTMESIQLKEDITILKGVVKEIEAQSYLLEPLVRLFLANYYAENSLEGSVEQAQLLQQGKSKERLERAKKNGRK